MRRKELLALTECDPKRFETLQQREQLPVLASGRWAEYSLDDAFRVRLLLDLIGDQEANLPSVPPSDAVGIVHNCMGYFDRHPLELEAGADLWCGCIVVESLENNLSVLRHTNWFAGELPHLSRYLTEKLADQSSLQARPVRMILVNASRAARFVRDRAENMLLPDRSQIYHVGESDRK